MILKRADDRFANNAFEEAGLRAERQMAHYLDRAFSDDPEIFVFHDLRLELKGEAAQIDHLVMYTCGFHLIESKSVTSSIRVNERDEWARLWDGSWKGMPSPILQAQRQGEFMTHFMNSNANHLLKPVLPFITWDYGKLRFDPWVAISDTGLIDQKVQPPHGNLLKADQIANAIRAQVAEDRRTTSLKAVFTQSPFKEMPNWITSEALVRLAKWLVTAHRPLRRQPSVPRVDPMEFREPVVPNKHVASDHPESKHCWKCNSRNLRVQKKFSPYFHCLDCGSNTSIRFVCRSPTCKPDLQEGEGGIFLRVCPQCGTKRPYFRNPLPSTTGIRDSGTLASE